jgi:hypothetical protein
MRLKQITAIFIGVCFVGLAALQYSRPDAVFWISVYLAAAILSFLAALERISRLALLGAFVVYTSGAIYFWTGPANGLSFMYNDTSSIATDTYIAMSLAAAGLSMLLFAIFYRKKASLHPPHVPGRLEHVPRSTKKWAN